MQILCLSPRRPQLLCSSFTGNFVAYSICGHNCTLLKISLRRSRRHRVNYSLNLGIRRWQATSFTPRPLYLHYLRYPVIIQPCGPHSQSGPFAERKYLLSLPRIKPRFLVCPARSLVTCPLPSLGCTSMRHDQVYAIKSTEFYSSRSLHSTVTRKLGAITR